MANQRWKHLIAGEGKLTFCIRRWNTLFIHPNNWTGAKETLLALGIAAAEQETAVLFALPALQMGGAPWQFTVSSSESQSFATARAKAKSFEKNEFKVRHEEQFDVR